MKTASRTSRFTLSLLFERRLSQTCPLSPLSPTLTSQTNITKLQISLFFMRCISAPKKVDKLWQICKSNITKRPLPSSPMNATVMMILFKNNFACSYANYYPNLQFQGQTTPKKYFLIPARWAPWASVVSFRWPRTWSGMNEITFGQKYCRF